jgi:phage terminase large subunit
MLNSDIAEMIKKKGFAKERIRADCAEPKSNDDLRRMGISRILPSVKGKDSIINGITKLQEYKMFVLPSCKNTIAELSSYCWKKDRQTDKPLNVPEDTNNHLCDALRYAFEDVKFFKPEDPSIKRPYNPEVKYNITSEDINGGWE